MSLEIPEPQHTQILGKAEEMVIVSTQIPLRYYTIIKEMVELDPEDNLVWWLRRAIISDVECQAESPCFLTDVYRERWLGMLKK